MCPPIVHNKDSYLRVKRRTSSGKYISGTFGTTSSNRGSFERVFRGEYGKIVREFLFSIVLKMRTVYHPSRYTFINPAVSL